MKKIHYVLISISSLLIFFNAQMASAASAWPGSTSSTQIGSGLTTLNSTDNGFEASGVEYLDNYGYIVNGDDGDLAVLDGAGNVLEYWFPTGDLEDITITNTTETDHLIYLANETGSVIEQFNLSTGDKTGRSWTLADLVVSGGAGFEALAFVPEAYAPAAWGTAQSGGFFVAASQAEAKLRVYTMDLTQSATVDSLATITVDYKDVAALNFNTSTELLYVVFDGADRIKEYTFTPSSTATYPIVHSYYLPTKGSLASDEGVVIVPDCATGTAQVVLTNDAVSSSVKIYNNYPVSCVEEDTTPITPIPTPVPPDADSDGYDSAVDCNDNDASVHTFVTYYVDNDGDGLGNANSTTSACSASAPTGYVTNSTDTNDSDYDNDGVSTSADCDDTNASVSSYNTYYRDADGDGLGDLNNATTVCGTTMPTGYVTNASDANDADYDNDGVSSSVDCNENDSTISANQTYYQDSDGDGLGNANLTTSICSYSVPSGYVTNSTDSNDSDYDNDGVNIASDCNDSDVSISANQTYYHDADGDGLGDPNVTTTLCSYTVPSGYVTNATDTDDAQIVGPTEPEPTLPEEIVLPDAPTNLTIERLALRKIKMSWDGNGEYYNVKLTDTTTGTTSTFTDITTTSKTVGKNYIYSRHTYSFTVQACNTQGCSAYSTAKSFKAYSVKQWRRVKRSTEK